MTRLIVKILSKRMDINQVLKGLNNSIVALGKATTEEEEMNAFHDIMVYQAIWTESINIDAIDNGTFNSKLMELLADSMQESGPLEDDAHDCETCEKKDTCQLKVVKQAMEKEMPVPSTPEEQANDVAVKVQLMKVVRKNTNDDVKEQN